LIRWFSLASMLVLLLVSKQGRWLMPSIGGVRRGLMPLSGDAAERYARL
jgi:hypothetical protein